MRRAWIATLLAFIICSVEAGKAQTAPSLENGFKSFGSYAGGDLDTVNLQTGNLIFHIPMFSYQQRGGALTVNNIVMGSSKNWQVATWTDKQNNIHQKWIVQASPGIYSIGPNGTSFIDPNLFEFHRARHATTDFAGNTTYTDDSYAIVTSDGAWHWLSGGTPSGHMMTEDGTGIQLALKRGTKPDFSDDTATVIFRDGRSYFIPAFSWPIPTPGTGNNLSGNFFPPELVLDGVGTTQTGFDLGLPTNGIDANGNVLSMSTDTLGRNLGGSSSVTSDYTGCATSRAITNGLIFNFPGPDGRSSTLKVCTTSFIPTVAFSQPNVGPPSRPTNGIEPDSYAAGYGNYIGSIVMPDGNHWSFDYDDFGNVTKITLPTGGTISYQWTEIADTCENGSDTHVSRAVLTRTTNDNNNHSDQWSYTWGTLQQDGSITNYVLDPDGNETAHVFRSVTREPCDFYEVETRDYQGTHGTGTLLRTVDTHYHADLGFTATSSFAADVVPDTITTTLPDNKVSKIVRQYDPGPGGTMTTYGKVTDEKEYDYGNALLREIVTTYQWQLNSAYLDAGFLDLPASVVIKDGSGCALAETDYTYDESNYITPYTGTLPPNTHVAAPAGTVRGNLTTVTKWLAATTTCNPKGGSAISTHTKWYDTGVPYQKIDALGHITTLSYDSAYAGAFATNTCSPQTGSVTHCVSGTYDLTTGLLESFTNENATTQASGATPGDSAHTSNYTYDTSWRLMSAQGPQDLSNGNARETTSFTPSAADAFPLSVQRQRFITSALADSSTTYFDGLARANETTHALPNGTATVLTSYDGLGEVTSVTNPYFTTSDSTYGVTSFIHDGLGRATQATKPDGSISSVTYNDSPAGGRGICTTTTDEAGKQRRTCTDALGRLVEVDEPGILFKAAGGVTSTGGVLNVGNQPITAGSSLTSFADNSGEHLFSVGSDQHIYQSYWNGSAWANQDLTALTGGASAAPGSAVTSFAIDLTSNGLGQNAMVAYLCSNQHICVMWWSTATGQWQCQDLTALTGGVPAASGSSLTSMESDLSTVGLGKNEYIYYTGSNQHVYQLWWSTSNFIWQNQDLTAMTNGALAVPGAALTSFSTDMTAAGQGLGEFVFYTGTNQHVYILWWNTVAWEWQNADLTAITNGAIAGPGSKLTSFFIDLSTHGLGFNQMVFYTGANQHIYALWWSTSNWMWQNQDLTAMTSCPLALVNGALTSFADGASGQASQHVYFIDINHKLNHLSWDTINWTWNNHDLTDATGNQTAATGTGLTGFVDSSGEHVFDVGNDLLLDQVSFDSTTGSWESSNPWNPFITLYNYDALGNLLCVEQHGDATTGTGCSSLPTADPTSPWRVRRFTYDSLSRLTSSSNPETNTALSGASYVRVNTTYTYDANGNLLQKSSLAPNQTGAAMQTVSYCYDELNRVTGKGYGAQSCPLATPVVSYAYDSGSNAKGHLTSLTDQAGIAGYTYDNIGRLATETRSLTAPGHTAVSKALSYDYNLDGSLAALHYPSGDKVSYTPGAAGLTLSAVDSGNNISYVTNATYGPDSGLTGFLSGHSSTFAGLANAFTYNKRFQPITMSATAPSQTVYSIGYDFHVGSGRGTGGADNGDIFGIINYKDTTRNRDQTFTYDQLNRLTSAQNAGTDCSATTLNGKTQYWGNSYGYDAWGNLLNKTITKCGAENLNVSVSAAANNQLGGSYQYDSAGNMTYDATENVSLTYDQENRITGAGGYNYTYDSNGNRVIKSNGATGTLYWYMTPGILAESDLAGNTTSEYVFFDGERVARRDGVNGAGGVFYYFSDHLKTASVITDAAGNIKAESDYYPWGGELQFTNNDQNHYKFTGKEQDQETGLDNLGLRYYGNALGRFTSPDPEQAAGFDHMDDPQAWNGYAYVRNNPLKYVDPDGDNYHVCDEHGQNCSDQSDADLDKNKQNAQSSGEVWKNGKIYVPDQGGNLQFKGTYNQTDVDLPGDPAANRAAAGAIVATFDQGMKEFGKNAAIAVVTAGVGQLVGAGIEAYQAGRAANAVAGTGTKAAFTAHAAVRAAERGISQAMVDEAITTAEQTGAISSRVGQYGTIQNTYHGTNGISVVVETEGANAGKAITVYRTGSN